jgi:hypothetical protein
MISANVLPTIDCSSKPNRSAYALFANWHAAPAHITRYAVLTAVMALLAPLPRGAFLCSRGIMIRL